MFFKLKSHFADFFFVSFGKRLNERSRTKFFLVLDEEGNAYGYTRYDSFYFLSQMFMDEAILRASDEKLPTPFDTMREAVDVLVECFDEIKVSEYGDKIEGLCDPDNDAYWGSISKKAVRDIIEIEKMAEKMGEDREKFLAIVNFNQYLDK